MRAPRRSRIAVLALILSIVATGAACSDEAETDPDVACQKLADVFCNKLNTCSPILVSTSYGDVATCITRYNIGCLGVLTAAGSQLSAAQISDCGNATSAQSCASLLDPAPPDACRARPGTLANGVACAEDHQCVGAYCKKGSGSSCGVCSKRVAAGEPCTSEDDCDYGLACPVQTCVMYVDMGTACDKEKPCRDPAVCVQGACANPGGAGAACDSLAGNCNTLAGLFCNPLTKICETVKVAKDGESCGLLSTGITVCHGSGKCKTGVGVVKGTCMKAANDGEACDAMQGPNCQPPASCVNNVCKLDDPAACK
jgi:hypothetical protein